MLKIRLQRVGRKHEPVFRVVLTDSQNSTKSGKFIEVLGSYDPRREEDSLNGDAIKNWIAKGAQPSDTVHNLLVKNQIIKGKKINVLPKKSPIKKEEVKTEEKASENKEEATAEMKAEEAPAVEEQTETKEEAPAVEEQTESSSEKPETPQEEAKEEPKETPEAKAEETA